MFALMLFVFVITVAFNGQDNTPQFANFSELKSAHLGQKPPGMIPDIFAPGYISTEKKELISQLF